MKNALFAVCILAAGNAFAFDTETVINCDRASTVSVSNRTESFQIRIFRGESNARPLVNEDFALVTKVTSLFDREEKKTYVLPGRRTFNFYSDSGGSLFFKDLVNLVDYSRCSLISRQTLLSRGP